MCEEEIKTIKKTLKELDIPTNRIKSIDIHWERLFKERAFPHIEIKLYPPN